MTRDEIVAEIKRGLGYRSDKTDEIIAKLRLAQIELEKGKTLPWFIVQEDQVITLAPDQNTYSLPSNFIRELDDEGFRGSSEDTDLIHVDKVLYDKAVAKYAGSYPGIPEVYALRSTTMVFFPTPEVETTIYHSYYAKQDDLLTAASNAWTVNAPDLLIGLAGMMIASDLRDSAAQQVFATQYALGKESLFKEIISREDANMVYSLGGAR